jgi:hypothetical protein
MERPEASDDDIDVTLIYPSNPGKYDGNIRDVSTRKRIRFQADVQLKNGEREYQYFENNEAAVNYIKECSVRDDRVKNVVIDFGEEIMVSLTQGQLMLCDSADLALVDKHLIHAAFSLTAGYYYAVTNGTPFHNLIMDHVPSDITVDHINRDSLDNRRCNLRLVSKRTQAINQKVRKTNKTGITGVGLNRNSWVARWRAYGRQCSKAFSCSKFGHKKAKRLAIEWRRNMEKTLPHYREALLL